MNIIEIYYKITFYCFSIISVIIGVYFTTKKRFKILDELLNEEEE